MEKVIVSKGPDLNPDTFHGSRIGVVVDGDGRLLVQVYGDSQSNEILVIAEYNEWKAYTWYKEESSEDTSSI
jgi:hypothetical protein